MEQLGRVVVHFTICKIEIINPRDLDGDARPENFPNASDYRNPIIAGAVKILGYVNRFNFGVVNTQKHLKANGKSVLLLEVFSSIP